MLGVCVCKVGGIRSVCVVNAVSMCKKKKLCSVATLAMFTAGM